MSNFVIIAVCLIGGFIVRRLGHFRREDAKPLNTVVLWLSLPALIFTEVPKIFRFATLSHEMLWVAGMPWIQFTLILLLALVLRKAFGFGLKTVGAITLTAGLANTSFVGFPVVEAFYGVEGLRYALLADQLGSFLALATVGLVVASTCAGRSVSATQIVKRVVCFPPFVSFCLAVLWGFSSLPVEGFVIDACRRLGGTVVPLALISVGWQLELSRPALKHYRMPLFLGLAYKLVLFPMFFWMLLRFFVAPESLMYRVTVLESAMGPMITAAVVAADFDLEPELAQLMVGIGIPVSLVSLSVWHWVLG
ncbi:MAG: AEC family transporter [Proteobacteria bacterium]|nr:MAG: AEC family transporter [Pseudomonadota bacterium]